MEQREFFISYTGADERTAEWVAKTLEAHGYSVYYQKRDIRPGENFVAKMNDFLKYSRNFLAIWSEKYANAPYCKAELEAAFKQNIEGRINHLLFVRIQDYPIDPLYSNRVKIDLFGLFGLFGISHRMMRKRLVEGIRKLSPPKSRWSTLSYIITAILVLILFSVSFQPYFSLEGKSADELYQLGYDYYSSIPPDYEGARERWEQAARKGSPVALYNLGELYRNGYGVPQNYGKAREYYEQAVERGNVSALNALGILYRHGYGVARNYDKARECWEQAAAKGSVAALYNLGLLYEYNYLDDEKALEYYKKAAEAGLEKATAAVERLREKLNL